MYPSIKTSLKSLQIIYSALMAGVLMFLVISLFINSMNGPFMPDEKQMMQMFIIISMVMGISSIAAGIILARKRFESLPGNITNEQRLDHYRSTMIVRAALMEGPSFFFIVCNLLFANLVFSIGAFVCLAVMMAYFPSKARIANEVGIESL